MFDYPKILSDLIFNNNRDKKNDDDNGQHHREAISTELAEKKLKELRTTLEKLADTCREHSLHRKHRDNIINEQIHILNCLLERPCLIA